MKTTVIVATYNRPTMVERLLKSLSDCDFPDNVDVLLVENGMKCGVEPLCRKYYFGKGVRYLHVPTAGKSFALNQAIAFCSAEFFIFFDDDVRVGKGAIKAYIEAGIKYGKNHFFGGPLDIDPETSCPAHLVPYLPRSAKGHKFSDAEEIIVGDRFDFFFGANWAAFREDLFSAGNFDEELGVSSSISSPVGEETYLQQLLINIGNSAVYIPHALVHHYVEAECYTLAWVRNRRFRLGVTDGILMKRNNLPSKSFFGIPAWVIRDYLENYCKAFVTNHLFRNLRTRTEAQMRMSYLAGLINGIKQT